MESNQPLGGITQRLQDPQAQLAPLRISEQQDRLEIRPHRSDGAYRSSLHSNWTHGSVADRCYRRHWTPRELGSLGYRAYRTHGLDRSNWCCEHRVYRTHGLIFDRSNGSYRTPG